MKRLLMTAASALALAACGGDEETRSVTGAGRGQAVIETTDGRVTVEVEIADSQAKRRKGLMGRDSLPDDAGMAFVFYETETGGFWMKDTEIPLSIAFYRNGRIVKILDMEPCESEPCEVYDPGLAYEGALEVNQGAFGEWGVKEGDRITIDAGA